MGLPQEEQTYRRDEEQELKLIKQTIIDLRQYHKIIHEYAHQFFQGGILGYKNYPSFKNVAQKAVEEFDKIEHHEEQLAKVATHLQENHPELKRIVRKHLKLDRKMAGDDAKLHEVIRHTIKDIDFILEHQRQVKEVVDVMSLGRDQRKVIKKDLHQFLDIMHVIISELEREFKIEQTEMKVLR